MLDQNIKNQVFLPPQPGDALAYYKAENDCLRSLNKELESKLYTCIEALEWARGLINESDLMHTNTAVFVKEALAKAKEQA